MSRARRPWLLASLLSLAPSLGLAQAPLTAEGTELVLTTAEGHVLRSRDLVGRVLDIAGRQIAVQGVEPDPRAVGGPVWLHHLQIRQSDGSLREYCEPDAEGRRASFPLPDGRGGFELTCTSGARGKCVRWGYRPWEERRGGPPLRALHRACVHMARADYGGDGKSATRPGISIDLYDRYGIQKANYEFDLEFEAAWGVEGAICVARPRIPALASLEGLARRYPRLAGHLGPAVCTESIARSNPEALLFDRSPR